MSPSNINTLHYVVDEIITELGHYSPLELLLRQGRLRYSDYESWRNGEIDFICDAFMGSSKRIITLLESARDYVQALGFSAEAICLHGWQGEKRDVPLSFCPATKSVENDLLANQYFRKEDVPQMDLFFDNTGVQLANDLIRVLGDRDVKNSEKKLNQLEQVDPSHPLCGQGAELLLAIQALQKETLLSDAEQQLNYLQQQLAPLAKDVLKAQSRDFMAPFWRGLADNIEASFYIDETPDLNVAYCYAQILLWPEVIKSIKNITKWQQYAPLFTRLAHACYQNDQRLESIQVLCDYCWIHPAADIFLPDDNNSIQAWNQFIDLELDDKWGQAYFPAWLLFNEPGLAKHIHAGSSDAGQVFKLLQQLFQVELEKNSADVDLRSELQAAHAGVFNCFLKKGVSD